MPDSVYKVVEVVGTSNESISKAISRAISKAGTTLRHPRQHRERPNPPIPGYRQTRFHFRRRLTWLSHPTPSKRSLPRLCQRVNDHWTGDRCGCSSEQGGEILFYPRETASVGLLCSCAIVENADHSHCIVGSINHVISFEAGNVADYRYRSLLDPARQLLCHFSLCSPLTDGRLHGYLLNTVDPMFHATFRL